MVFRDNWAIQLTAQVLVVAGFSVLIAFGQEAAPGWSPSTETIVERLMTARSRQARQLHALNVVRDYRVDYHGFGGSRHAEMQVMSSYISPNRKDFRIISQSGSRFLLDHILNKLLESERDYQLDEADSDLSPRNYEFKLLGTDQVAGNDAYVMEITPRRKAKYLCRGRIWVSARDFAIVRLEGEPAKNPSFWVSHTQMANTYQKVGEFWLPVHKDATTDLRLGGRAVLAIDYSRYRIAQNARGSLEASSWALWGTSPPDPPPADQP
jgi:MucB/RseB N-terminal domain